MPPLAPPGLPYLHRLDWMAALDILAVAFLIYQFILIVKGRRAGSILLGLGVLCALYLVALTAHLDLLRTLLASLAPYTVFAVVVMFQSEIRRLLARLGQRRWVSFRRRLQDKEFSQDILLALGTLAEKKTGALIVVERDIGLRTFVESGVALDACLSRDLLITIFQNGGPLHDGAAIVQGDKIAAAACFLPLSTSAAVTSDMGTRHRAAIGITEEADCLALVVSEETGQVSVAAFGEMTRNLTLQEVEERLALHFVQRKRPDPRDASRLASFPEVPGKATRHAENP